MSTQAHRNTLRTKCSPLLALVGLLFLFGVSCSNPNSSNENSSSTTVQMIENEDDSLGLVGGATVNVSNDATSKSLVFLQMQFRAEDGKILSSACTGTVFDPRFVMTAAHCVLAPKKGAKLVKLFVIPFSDSEISLKAEKIFFHSKFDMNKKLNTSDLAVIKLREQVPSSVQAVGLANEKVVLSPQSKVTSYGFGVNSVKPVKVNQKIFFEKSSDQKLRKAQFGVKFAVNLNLNRELSEDEQVLKGIIIMRAQESSLCQGDSGGPTFFSQNGKQVLLGVNSFVTADSCKSNDNGIIDVRHHLKWISNQMRD